MAKVQMPQLGESVAEGTIGKWLKKPGDHVAKYEPIVEVITDKVNAEVPSPFEGTLTEILVQEGETVPNNTEIAVIETAEGAELSADATPPRAPAATAEATADEAAPQAAAGGNGPAGSDERPERAPEPATPPAPPPSLEQPTAQPAPSPMAASAATAVAAPQQVGSNGHSGPNGYSGPTTPAVRRLAREHNIDLAVVAGTGHGGRVTREDVLKFVESGGANAVQQAPAAASTAAPATAEASAPAFASAPQAPSAPSSPSPVAQGDSLKQPSQMRKAIAVQMTKSLGVPVAYTVIEVDMSGVVGLRDKVKGQYQSQEGISLTYDAFVAKATVEALKKHADF